MARNFATRYPVALINQGKLHAQQLYDVNGNIIRNPETGLSVNVFQPEMEDLVNDGAIRLIHKVTPGYVYIVTNTHDESTFKYERDNGSEYPGTEYSVYFDDDFTPPRNSRWAYYREQQ